MNLNFEQYLNTKKCFKLILGAGNQDYEEITKLTALYSKAGCKFFDVNASIEAIRAVKTGLKIAGRDKESFICVSIGTKNDPHLTKYKINSSLCSSCSTCEKVCLEKAIYKSEKTFQINEKKCIGCKKCFDTCNAKAIEGYSKNLSFSEILPPLIKEGIDCIEYHVSTIDENDVQSGWKSVISIFKGALSVCLDRSKLGNEQIKERLLKMKSSCNNLFIIQADGAPMSGGKDDYKTTLQAVATSDIIEKLDITPYIFLSGGTNSKTMELINLCNIKVSGLAVGSFARKIVKEEIEQKDFLNNSNLFNQALFKAKSLVDTIQK